MEIPSLQQGGRGLATERFYVFQNEARQKVHTHACPDYPIGNSLLLGILWGVLATLNTLGIIYNNQKPFAVNSW